MAYELFLEAVEKYFLKNGSYYISIMFSSKITQKCILKNNNP